jgi:hypothetical protein
VPEGFSRMLLGSWEVLLGNKVGKVLKVVRRGGIEDCKALGVTD